MANFMKVSRKSPGENDENHYKPDTRWAVNQQRFDAGIYRTEVYLLTFRLGLLPLLVETANKTFVHPYQCEL
jgi:hypothetical protein